MAKKEEKDGGDEQGKEYGKDAFFLCHWGNHNLAFAFLGRIFQPSNTSGNSGGKAHEKVSNHFSPVAKVNGNNSIKNTKKNDEKLSYYVALCNKNKRSHPHEWGDEGEEIKLPAQKKGKGNGDDRAYPKTPLKYGKIG